ncbi:MAG: hypothetical protein CL928_17190, partial [Deltaproteobacteria bacterium]|nr:hypothetical protein [Deltaproteobacteria bacterium]
MTSDKRRSTAAALAPRFTRHGLRLIATGPLLVLMMMLTACGEWYDPAQIPCYEDSQCLDGYLCVDRSCVPPDQASDDDDSTDDDD